MPRPRAHTPARLAAAALAVIDRDGLPGLSMRAVAVELGISTMALYRYVEDRDALEALVVELALSTLDSTPPPAGPWPGRVTALVRRLRTTVGAHPAVLPLTLTHRHRSPSVLRWAETLLGVLTEAGLGAEERVVALRALLAYVIGAVQQEHLGALAGPGTAAIASLPAEEYPHLAGTAETARALTPAAEFDGGLTLLLNGLRRP
ncbi:TetR/AcrR family transcriptional regulator C-terminal domain-containing protein [Streptomyces sp. H27-S2]|uniref:TetR/AcrR family transcriptional regulator C-terminal domain-containing protein n=1 Tax=Streptomyces antarcticus TaxID=2996458 RepID=UPI00226D663A|nr:TetR/AcrR family transcriptional regulator C-terminal domain-containing protein [Streptomyces sp. H27-S2]MCY0955212.1 TetR/AcrR family transcriptional regulator C-terminal domain-containing protein [Streptomyces sp. H27-S2]